MEDSDQETIDAANFRYDEAIQKSKEGKVDVNAILSPEDLALVRQPGGRLYSAEV